MKTIINTIFIFPIDNHIYTMFLDGYGDAIEQKFECLYKRNIKNDNLPTYLMIETCRDFNDYFINRNIIIDKYKKYL